MRLDSASARAKSSTLLCPLRFVGGVRGHREGRRQTHAQQVPHRLDEGQSFRQRLGPPPGRAEDWGLVEGLVASSERMGTVVWEAKRSRQRRGTLLLGTRHRRKFSGVGRSSRCGRARGRERA